MFVTSKIKMNLDRGGVPHRMDAVQGDTNTRQAAVSLFVNDLPWTIPAGITAQVRYRKPDGTGGKYDTMPDGTPAWAASGNTVTVTLAPQMLTAAGQVEMQVELLQGAASVATFTITVYVAENPAADAEESQDYFNIRGWLVAQLNEALEAARISGEFVPELAVGSVATLAAGRNASAALKPEGERLLLHLGIPAGKTPVKGTDYWTQAELDAVKAELAATLSQLTPQYADTVADCTDKSKVYVLPNGYLYAYMTKNVYTPPVELYDPAAASLNMRHSGTPGTVIATNGYVITDYISVDMTARELVRLKVTAAGFNAESDTTPNFQKIGYYNTARTCLGSHYINPGNAVGSAVLTESDGSDTILHLGWTNANAKDAFYDEIAYVRIEVKSASSTATDTDRSLIVSIIDPDAVGTATLTGWQSTGHAFVPADCEDRVLTLEAAATAQAADIQALQAQIPETAAAIPAYWQAHLDEKADIINTLQEAGGKDCFSFAAIADIHESANLGKCSGALAREVMDRCGIKYALGLGDTVTRASVTTQAAMDESFARAEEIVAPIRDRLLQTQGNHDGSWGDDGSTYYINEFPPEKMHNLIYRKTGRIPGVHADDTGSAYYVDDPANRVRYIMLNSHFAPYQKNADGSAKYSTFRNARFGQAQFDWMAQEALNVASGWAIIVGSHVPLNDDYLTYFGGRVGNSVLMRRMLEAYNRRATFAANITGTLGYDDINIQANFSQAAGEVIAAIAGHSHTDTWADCGIPVITVRCDGAEENTAELQNERVAGTVTEQSFDIFTVNRKTHTIYATKIGAGEDRVISY